MLIVLLSGGIVSLFTAMACTHAVAVLWNVYDMCTISLETSVHAIASMVTIQVNMNT